MRILRLGASRMAEVQADLRRLPADQQELRGPVTMFSTARGYNFTERVRRVLALAREEANDLRHEYVGTEHILLGVIREGHGTANDVILNFGVNGRQLRLLVVNIVKAGPEAGGTRGSPRPDLPYTSRAKKTLELAMSEA